MLVPEPLQPLPQPPLVQSVPLLQSAHDVPDAVVLHTALVTVQS
jgi:hypothetical protein